MADIHDPHKAPTKSSSETRAASSRSRRGQVAVAAGIAVATWVVLGLTAADIGLTYDEPIYMGYADKIAHWLSLLAVSPGQALSYQGVRVHWYAKDRHPGLAKLTAAITSRVCMALHLLPGWAAPLTWMRTGTMFWVGLALVAMYLTMRAGGVGTAASLFAPAVLLFTPRVFGHAHLLTMDAPAMATCFIAVAAAWWAMEREDRPSILLAGLAFGMAISTKLNGFFVPLATLPYALWLNRRRGAWLAASYLTVGLAVFFALWPWLWYETWARLAEYLAFHWRHWEIAVTYFGSKYRVAPWHYAPVMIAITTPLLTLVLATAGLGGWLGLLSRTRKTRLSDLSPKDRLWLLAGWALLVNLAPSMLPSAPKYGGIRLFLPAMAWVAILAAFAISRVLAHIRRARLSPEKARVLAAAVATVALLPSLAQVAHYHPYHLSAYNELVGGLPGAVRLGFEPTYWGDTYLAAALWLSRNAPAGAVVWIDPPGVESIMKMYKYLGPLRADIRTVAGPDALGQADFAVSQNKPTEFSAQVRQLLHERAPVWTEELDGVPLAFIWRLQPNQAERQPNQRPLPSATGVITGR